MMTTKPSTRSTLDEVGRRYVDGASVALAGLDVAEREELLSDIADAIAELEGVDTYEGLVERLGEPVGFARELRESSGVAAPDDGIAGAAAASGAATVVLPAVVTRAVSHLSGVGKVADWCGRELEPVWWIVRALAVVVVYSGVLGVGRGSGGLVVAVTVVLLAASFARGISVRRRGEPSDRMVRLQGVAVIGTGVIVFWAVAAFAFNSSDVEYVTQGEGYPVYGEYGLQQPNGDNITNIYAFDAAGERIDDVRLFDQDGRPVNIGGISADGTLPSGECCFESDYEEGEADGEQRFRVFDTARNELFNVFPIRYASVATGEIANPEAGWPQAPPALLVAPSIKVSAATDDEIEAEVERRVQEALRGAKGGAKQSGAPGKIAKGKRGERAGK